MVNIGRRIAAYIIDNWDNIGKAKRWLIKQIVGSQIGTYVRKGIGALTKYLKKQASNVLEQLASCIGL